MQPQVVQQQPQVVQHTTIIEKTVEKEAEKPVVTKQPGKWSHDILGCFEDTETLLLVAFCPCSAAGEFFKLVAVIFTEHCCKNLNTVEIHNLFSRLSVFSAYIM